MKLKPKQKKQPKQRGAMAPAPNEPSCPKGRKLSRIRKPESMSLREWQSRLRREYGRELDYELENVGDAPLFSEFLVTNPENQRTYRVAIRGEQTEFNYCSCPDFVVNLLRTCKHFEFTLAQLEKKAGEETVDQVSSHIPEAVAESTENLEDGEMVVPAETETAPPFSKQDMALVELLKTGRELITQLEQALLSPEKKIADPVVSTPTLIQKDEKTVDTNLKIPVPSPNTLEDLSQAVQPLFGLLQTMFKK